MADYYFTEEEKKLIEKIGFDFNIFEILKRAIDKEIFNIRQILPERFAERLIGVCPNEIESLMYWKKSFKKSPVKGISIQGTVIEDPQVFILNLNKQLNPLGYIGFLTDSTNKPEYADQVAIIKSTDKMDILTLLPTPFPAWMNANYPIINKELVDQLKIWDKKYGVQIIGAGYNWVEVVFDKLPEDIAVIEKDVDHLKADTFVLFSKDESKETELKKLKEDKYLLLWWEG